MRQKFSLEKELGIDYTLVFGVSLCMSTLGNEVKGVFLRLDNLC